MTPRISLHSPARVPPLATPDERYADRVAAGRQLAELLRRYGLSQALVLGLPPGGMVIAGEVARALRLPLDVLVAREFYVLANPPVAVGAVSEGGGLCLNAAALRLPGVVLTDVWEQARRMQRDVARLVTLYRGQRILPPLHRRPVILVDDGIESGLIQLAAIQMLRYAHAQRSIIATPCSSLAIAERVGHWADLLVALHQIDGDRDGRCEPWQRPIDDDEAAALLEHYRQRSIALNSP